MTPAIGRPRLVPHARYRWDRLRRQHQLLFPEGVLVLNETAAAIVRLCDGRPLAELLTALGEQFPDGNMGEDVNDFLDRLARKGLLRDDGASYTLVLVAELTYRCPLHCPYCSNPLELERYRRELETAEWLRVLSEAAELGVVQVHFSGGEPLVRRDLAELVRQARRLDLYSNLSTGGTLADDTTLERLKEAGLDALQVSLLDSNPDANDFLAGVSSFDKKRRAVETGKRLGLPITLNVVLHRHNLGRLEEIIDLACLWGVEKVELAHTQYTGWAFRNRAAPLPTREQFERAAAVVAEARNRLAGRLDILHVLPDYFQEYPKACLQGWGRVFLTVAPDGAVLPCQTAREIPGLVFPSVRETSLEEIWFRSPVFQRFRGTDWMPEPCRSCERRAIDFGGCRCQHFLLTGDPAATDPVCRLAPLHALVTQALQEPARELTTLQFRHQ